MEFPGVGSDTDVIKSALCHRCDANPNAMGFAIYGDKPMHVTTSWHDSANFSCLTYDLEQQIPLGLAAIHASLHKYSDPRNRADRASAFSTSPLRLRVVVDDATREMAPTCICHCYRTRFTTWPHSPCATLRRQSSASSSSIQMPQRVWMYINARTLYDLYIDA